MMIRFLTIKILSAMLLLFAVLTISCTDDELVPSGQTLQENVVIVNLPIELEDVSDGVDLTSQAPAVRSVTNGGGAFDMQLMSATQTRAASYTDALKDAKPTTLARVQVLQKLNNGTVTSNIYSNVVPGRNVSLKLTACEDCELIIWVRGASGDLTTTNWNTYEAGYSTIKNITAETHITTDGKMPYLLHLKNVKVAEKAGASGEGIIQSPAGKDVRLRLRRLASRLNVTWDYAVNGYELQSVELLNFPAKYVAYPSETGTYPDLLSSFTFRMATTAEVNARHFSCWVPRNVRGTKNVNLPTQRGKDVAPSGSTYLRFVAVANDGASKKKLIYRVYLGANNTSDFNIRDNTNYWYHINFKHTNGEAIIQTDGRVEYQNGISAAENNENLVPTANCFMIEPGGAFCFDPYLYRQNGVDIDNLTGKSITSVKLLWQIKEDGDVGEPSMGIVNSSADHTNIVDVRRADGSEVSSAHPLTGKDQGYIYCRVANTKGGSGVIAAYNGTTLIWSWHVWVTNYHPNSTTDETVLGDENRRKMKYVKGEYSSLPFMDRNLGAQAGFVEYPTQEIDKSKACGFHYQRGSRTLYPSSYSYKTISGRVDCNLSDGLPPENILNQYQPDGVTYYTRESLKGSDSNGWIGELKTIKDPCPAGWRVPSYVDFKPLFDAENPVDAPGKQLQSTPRGQTVMAVLDNGQGGCLLRYDNDAGHYTYYRMTGYQPVNSFYFQNIGTGGNVSCREDRYGFSFAKAITENRWRMFCIGLGWSENDAHTIRCIQEAK